MLDLTRRLKFESYLKSFDVSRFWGGIIAWKMDVASVMSTMGFWNPVFKPWDEHCCCSFLCCRTTDLTRRIILTQKQQAHWLTTYPISMWVRVRDNPPLLKHSITKIYKIGLFKKLKRNSFPIDIYTTRSLVVTTTIAIWWLLDRRQV